MFLPAILIVFVMSPDPAEPTTTFFQNAALEVLGPSAAIRVENLETALPDAAALERATGADGVVELRWDSARQSVLLHCYITSQARWVDRTIRFGGTDRDAERGRLLGFAVASMYLDAPSFARARHELDVPAAPPLVPVLEAPLAPARWEATAPAPLAVQPTGGRSLEFSAVAVPGFAGANAELGAAVALRIVLSEPLWLRLELSGRTGEIPAAQASVHRLLAGLGIAWSLLPERSPVELGLRTDALGSWLEIAHLSSDDVERVHRQRWLLGADAMLSLGYRFSTLAAFYAGAGLEAMSGRTHVYTHGVEVATVPNLRGVAEAGFRTSF
jgi:hypothetical protein